MAVRDQLLALQWAQLKHDEAYHKDVVILSIPQRIKHMALHNTKYTAHLLSAVKGRDDTRFVKTLVDAFVIALASANALNLDLGKELGNWGTLASFEEAGRKLADRLGRDADDKLWMVHEFARYNGQLAKICESWDHLEPIPFREGMSDCILKLLKIILAEAQARWVDLTDAYQSRIRSVEMRSMFDSHLRKDAGRDA